MADNNSYALVTGASAGIGYELAKLFAEDGYNLVIVARTEEDLKNRAAEFSSQYGIQVVPIAKDLFLPQSAQELYEEVRRRNIRVDVLVNDAGQGQFGPFAEIDLQRHLEIIQLNITSLTALTHFFLRDMLERNSGKILQLASIGSNIPGPLQAVYHASKAYVLSFTEALVNELKDSAVSMTALQPGVTDTDFFNKAGAQDAKMVQDKSKMDDPAKVAKDGYEALMKGEDKIVSGVKNKVLVGMSHVVPDPVLAEQLRKQSEPAEKKEEKK